MAILALYIVGVCVGFILGAQWVREREVYPIQDAAARKCYACASANIGADDTAPDTQKEAA